MSDSGFDTKEGMDFDRIVQAIMQGVSRAFGGPAMAGPLKNILSEQFGHFFQNTASMSHGYSIPFGSTSLFGQRNVGAGLAGSLADRAVKASLERTTEVMNEQKLAFNTKLLQTTFGMSEADAKAAAGSKFALANMASNALWATQQHAQAKAGFGEGIRYLGVSGFAHGDQVRRRKALGQITENLMGGDINPYGMSGADYGRLFAETARTGGFGEMNLGDDSADNITAMTARVRTTLDQAARAVQSFRQVFSGSVPQVLDQINAVMGTDVLQTFGSAGAELTMNRTMAMGSVAGFTPHQMMTLTAGSRSISERAGLEGFGAMNAAQATAGMFAVGAHTGVSRFGVHEPRLRESLLRRATGAQESQAAREIAGAASLLQGEDRDKFLAEVGGIASGDLNAGALTGLLGKYRVTAGASDILNASYTEEAERIRMTRPEGQQAALRHNMSVIDRGRKAVLGQMVQASGLNIDVANLTGPATEENVRKFLAEQGVKGGQLEAMVGQFAKHGHTAAKTMGESYRDLEWQLKVVGKRTALDDIEKSVGLGEGMMTRYAGLGAAGGFKGLREYLTKRGDDRGTLLESLLGKKDIDLTGEHVDKLSAMGKVGAGAAFEMARFGTYKGKLITEDEQKEAQAVLAGLSVEGGDKAAREFGKKYAQGDVFEMMAYEESTSGNVEEAKTRAILRQVIEHGGVRDLDKDQAKTVLTALRATDDMAGAARDVGMTEEGLRAVLQDAAEQHETIGGAGSTLGGIERLLQSIFNFLTDFKGTTKEEDTP